MHRILVVCLLIVSAVVLSGCGPAGGPGRGIVGKWQATGGENTGKHFLEFFADGKCQGKDIPFGEYKVQGQTLTLPPSSYYGIRETRVSFPDNEHLDLTIVETAGPAKGQSDTVRYERVH